MRKLVLFCVILLAMSGSSFAGQTTRVEISGDLLILSYSDSRDAVIFRREGNSQGLNMSPMKIDIPGTWTLNQPGNTPEISRNKLWPGIAGRNYSYTLRANESRLRWSAKGLPKGLSCSQTGRITGKPSESGMFSVDIEASGKSGTTTQTFPLKIFADTKPRIVTESLPEAFVNVSYDFRLKMNDSPACVLMAGTIPEGLTLDNTGRIHGRPSKTGEYVIDITAANDSGESSSSLTLKVSSRDIPRPSPKPKPKPRNVPRISTSLLKQAFTGEEYSFTLKASGISPVTWSADSLPSGLSLDSSTGIISGTPSADFKEKITFTATNTEGTSSRALSLSVKTRKPKILTALLTGGFTGEDYRSELKAEGGPGISWEFRGNIPDGLSFSKSGVLEGIPQKPGRFTLNVSAVNSGGKATRRFTLRVFENFPHDYITAAVIPAFMESADGTYDFLVSIDANVPAGSYMEWHPFPNGVEADGETYAFTDSEGKETTTVPENHRVTVKTYLEGGVIYEPVITARVRVDEKKANPPEPDKYSGCRTSGIFGAMALLIVAQKKCLPRLRKRQRDS